LSGLHPLLGAVAAGERGGQAAHVGESFPPRDHEDRGLVPPASAPTDPGATRDSEPENACTLRLLRHHRELSIPGTAVVRGEPSLAQVAEPPLLGRLPVVA